MGIGIFILAIIAILGGFSIYRNGKKNTIINKVIQDFLTTNNSTLIKIETPENSGPFQDEIYDAQDNLYFNLGYRPNETVYKKVSFQTTNGVNKLAWLQLRIENLKATYTEWKE